jgi:anti-repressor protein
MVGDIAISDDRRMTVREVADALGCDDETVRRHVKSVWPNLFQNGETAYLDESMVLVVKQKLGTSGRNDLRNVAEAREITTALEIEELTIKVIAYHKAEADRLRAENIAQKEQLAIAAPKVEFFDQVADSKDAIPMRDAAAALNIPGVGRNHLFAFLREKKVLDDKNLPYREYQDRGYFRIVERSWTDSVGESHVTLTTYVYQRGLDFIRKLIGERKAA